MSILHMPACTHLAIVEMALGRRAEQWTVPSVGKHISLPHVLCFRCGDASYHSGHCLCPSNKQASLFAYIARRSTLRAPTTTTVHNEVSSARSSRPLAQAQLYRPCYPGSWPHDCRIDIGACCSHLCGPAALGQNWLASQELVG